MRDITITINFPALDALVAYLNNQQQSQVDALAAKVTQLTSTLSQSSTSLQAAEDASKH